LPPAPETYWLWQIHSASPYNYGISWYLPYRNWFGYSGDWV